ncbi:hypothetical protein BDA99DRAFT_535747 [Phascolomyces articulosus]|uniref:Uncharacterized protein n=1 Tax=Phascolomyces articulosus TaxID=60185 RepID=A0AAD5PFH2_9FUNG|nr:hypothetical protein BDA99DRAFT_535747 [Phascolomyces articulosus]
MEDFRNVFLSYDDATLLEKAAQSMPSVKRVEFITCDIPYRNLYGDCIKKCRCPNTENYTTIPSNLIRYDIPRLYKRQREQQRSSLAFLRLSHPYLSLTSVENTVSELIFPLLLNQQQYPQLITLVLDGNLFPRISDDCIAHSIFKLCPQLVNLIVIDDDANFSETWIDDNNNCINSTNKIKDQHTTMTTPSSSSFISSSITQQLSSLFTTTTSFFPTNITQQQQQQLRRLFIKSPKFYLYNYLCTQICKHVHKTLELLYFHCAIINHGRYVDRAFYTLSKQHWPKLREIHFNLRFDRYVNTIENQKLQYAFVNLFSRCPALESFTIVYTEGGPCYPLRVNDKILKSMARHCSSLRHLCIRFDYYYTTSDYTVDGILAWATIIASGGRIWTKKNSSSCQQFTHLEMYFPSTDILLPVITKLKKLKRLVLRTLHSFNRSAFVK